MRCIVTGEIRADTPEEHVRQAAAAELIERLGYRRENMRLELPIQMGSSANKRADIAIFPSGVPHHQDNAYVIVECKRADVSDSVFESAVEQLKSYMSACNNSHFGMVIAGRRRVCFREIKHPDGRYERVQIHDLPHAAAQRARFTYVDSASSPQRHHSPQHAVPVTAPQFTPQPPHPLPPQPQVLAAPLPRVGTTSKSAVPAIALGGVLAVVLLGGGCVALFLLRGGSAAQADTPHGSWTPERPPERWTATVVVSEAKKYGIVRSAPSSIAPITGRVSNGATVDVLESRAPGKTWYKVRASSDVGLVEGWMHTDILR